MTPSARVQAAIDILDQVLTAARSNGAAADTLIARYFKERRYAGSKDRRAVRDLVYRAIRRSGDIPPSGRAAMIGVADDDEPLLALFDGSPHAPAPIDAGEARAHAAVVPAWLIPRFDPLVGADEHAALLERAPLDLRVNRLKGTRDEAQALLPGAEPAPYAPFGLRLPEGTQVEQSEAWLSGLVEVQDEGSQLLALACNAKPGMTIVDLCAGAGGKTLALAADMSGEGRLIACDVDRNRLSRMAPRLERAGVQGVETRLLDPNREAAALADLVGQADIVLVDAPCSGSGTWRRNPETRWRLNAKGLERLTTLQSRLIDVATELVRPDGLLVYAVCSLLAEEGQAQAAAFTARSSFIPRPIGLDAGRDAGTGRLLTPSRDRTDGFFVATWQAP